MLLTLLNMRWPLASIKLDCNWQTQWGTTNDYEDDNMCQFNIEK